MGKKLDLTGQKYGMLTVVGLNHIDRDFNASSNLEYVAASSAETRSACGV
jgi:hypothetical protein